MGTETLTGEQRITAQLQDDGWELLTVCIDPGSYKDAAKWSVTLKRHGQDFTTDYTSGCAHRMFDKTAFHVNYRNGIPYKGVKKGKRSPGAPMFGRMTVAQRRVLQCTEPIPPTLADVMYCLGSDASMVRHGQSFDEFCADFGYDTDSREAERCYDGCTDEWRALVRLGADLDQLDELFQDY